MLEYPPGMHGIGSGPRPSPARSATRRCAASVSVVCSLSHPGAEGGASAPGAPATSRSSCAPAGR
eukprot:5133289-Alexandrium_andersonii.AAC.1